MIKKAALGFLVLTSPAILLTFWVSHPVAQVVFAVLVTLFPVALIVVGAVRGERLGALTWPLTALAIWLVGCVGIMLLFRGQVLDGPWFGGLPLAAAAEIYGAWLTPLVLVSLAYGLTFDRFTLTREDLDKFERVRKSVESGDR